MALKGQIAYTAEDGSVWDVEVLVRQWEGQRVRIKQADEIIQGLRRELESAVSLNDESRNLGEQLSKCQETSDKLVKEINQFVINARTDQECINDMQERIDAQRESIVGYQTELKTAQAKIQEQASICTLFNKYIDGFERRDELLAGNSKLVDEMLAENRRLVGDIKAVQMVNESLRQTIKTLEEQLADLQTKRVAARNTYQALRDEVVAALVRERDLMRQVAVSASNVDALNASINRLNTILR